MKEKNGHTIYTCLQPQCLTWKQSSRSSENLLFGSYSWIPLFKQQFILVKTMRWIYISGCLWNSYSMKLEDWSVIKQKSLVWKRLISRNLRGDRQAYSAAELFRSPIPKPTSSPIQCFAWERWDVIRVQLGWTTLTGIGKQSLQGYESNRRHADGVRVENLPRIHDVGHHRRDSKFYGRYTVWNWAFQRQDHLHVNVQRHCTVRKRKHREACSEFYYNCAVCSQIPSRSLVFLVTWIRKEMARNLFW